MIRAMVYLLQSFICLYKEEMTSLNLKVPDVSRTEMFIAGIEAITESKTSDFIYIYIYQIKRLNISTYEIYHNFWKYLR